MFAAGLYDDPSLFYKRINFFAAFLLTEVYNKKENPKYESPYLKYIDCLPGDANNFPVCYSDDVLSLLDGSSTKDFVL